MATHGLEDGELHVEGAPARMVWLDTGSFDSLNDANSFFRTIGPSGVRGRRPRGRRVADGYLTADEVRTLAEPLRSSGCGDYLLASSTGPTID